MTDPRAAALAEALEAEYRGTVEDAGAPDYDGWPDDAERILAALPPDWCGHTRAAGVTLAPSEPFRQPCDECGGEGWTAETTADPLPSGEPGEPYQVQRTCDACGGEGSFALASADPCPHCDMQHVWPCPTIPRCDEPGCERETSCGWPSPAGYRRTCGEHYREYERTEP
jgi:hypothetical protein